MVAYRASVLDSWPVSEARDIADLLAPIFEVREARRVAAARAEVIEAIERSYDHTYDDVTDSFDQVGYAEGYRHRESQIRTVLSRFRPGSGDADHNGGDDRSHSP